MSNSQQARHAAMHAELRPPVRRSLNAKNRGNHCKAYTCEGVKEGRGEEQGLERGGGVACCRNRTQVFKTQLSRTNRKKVGESFQMGLQLEWGEK